MFFLLNRGLRFTGHIRLLRCDLQRVLSVDYPWLNRCWEVENKTF